jgi:hypothetical protein
MHMSHSPYEPSEGVGRAVDQDPSDTYEVGTEAVPGSGAAYGDTYARPADDLYAPLPEGGASVQGGTSSTTENVKGAASDVKDTAVDQGRRVADTAKEQAGQVKDTAVEQAGQVKDTAVEQGQQVAAQAKDQAVQVKDQAVGSLRDIVGQGRSELTTQVGTSQNRLAEYVHSLSDELGTLASGGGDGTGPLADLAHRGARTGGELSKWLSDHEPADVLNEVTRFARRRPWAFLGASLLTGVVVGRVTRSLAAEKKDEHDAQQAVDSYSTPAVTGPSYAAPVETPATTGYEAGYQQTGYEPTTATTGYTPGYVAGDLPENPAPQTWTGGAR